MRIIKLLENIEWLERLRRHGDILSVVDNLKVACIEIYKKKKKKEKENGKSK